MPSACCSRQPVRAGTQASTVAVGCAVRLGEGLAAVEAEGAVEPEAVRARFTLAMAACDAEAPGEGKADAVPA